MSELEVDNPFTGEVVFRGVVADWNRVQETLARARLAQRNWRETRVAERVALVLRAVEKFEARADEIARDITAQMGKPLGQAEGELRTMAARARHMASIAEASLADVRIPTEGAWDKRIVKEPLGVVLDLPAWNYPLLTAVNVIVPAVLAGNAVIVRHSPRTPRVAEHFARAFEEASQPKDLVQALVLDHKTTELLCADAGVDHVVFTGSVHGGHRLVQATASRFMHLGLELGGNDAAYVAPDCDFDKTVENVVDGAIYNAGQSCCAVERVYVHQSLYPRFVEAAEALVKAYVLGDPLDPKTTLGPIAQPWHPGELDTLVRDAEKKGARLVTGGKSTQVDGKGRFFEATLLADVPADAALMRGESFGPILPIAPVASDEEALARMNDSSLGLTASIWTLDANRAARLAHQLEVGTVFMNRCDYVDPALPWTGVKDSGRGHSLSALGFDTLTRPKSLHFRLAW